MDFQQVEPRLAESDDGSVVELVDRHSAQLRAPSGTWLVELGPGTDPDFFSLTVFPDSLLRSGGEGEPGDRHDALHAIVTGLRALHIQVDVAGVSSPS